MLKTYQFKTHFKGDSHSSKSANIILPGLMIKQRYVLTAASEMVFKFIELRYVGWNNSSHLSCIAYYIYFRMCRLTINFNKINSVSKVLSDAFRVTTQNVQALWLECICEDVCSVSGIVINALLHSSPCTVFPSRVFVSHSWLHVVWCRIL